MPSAGLAPSARTSIPAASLEAKRSSGRGRAGQGRAGQGRAGQGRAGADWPQKAQVSVKQVQTGHKKPKYQ